MGLTDAIAGIADALAGVTGVDAVLTAPPTDLTQTATVFLHERPGQSTVQSHDAYQNADTVFVEFHRLIAKDPSSAIADTRSVLDAMRARLWDRYKNGRFGNSVVGMSAIGTEGPAPMEYGESVSFGFRLRLDIVHSAPIGS